MPDSSIEPETLLVLVSDIVSAHVSNNTVASTELPGLITKVYGALAGLGKPAVQVEERPEPAVSVRASVKPDFIICLEDGKKMKMLKRHLMTDHSMTPDQYRERWNLAPDYPMAAPNYSVRRRDIAKQIGLGRKDDQKLGVGSESADQS